jgi:hypothetical protein
MQHCGKSVRRPKDGVKLKRERKCPVPEGLLCIYRFRFPCQGRPPSSYRVSLYVISDFDGARLWYGLHVSVSSVDIYQYVLIKCAILSTTQRNPESSGLPSPEYVSRESVDLAMRSLRHKVCSRQLWQNSM